MKSASLLVYAPAIPLVPENLLPQRELGVAAAALLTAGHDTQVIDCGTLDVLQRMATPALRAQARNLAECAGEQVFAELPRDSRTRQAAGRLRPYLECARQQRDLLVVAEAGASRALDFVAFFARSGEDAAETVGVAALLKAHRPELRLALFGPYAQEFGPLFLDATRHLDVVFVEEFESTLPAWAEVVGDPERWEGIPGILYRDGGLNRRTRSVPLINLGELPGALYTPPAYAAPELGGKIGLYTIEVSRGVPRRGYGAPEGLLSPSPVRTKAPAVLHEEMLHVHRSTGTRAFHLSGRGAPANVQDALAVLLAAHPLEILYSRSAAIARMERDRLPVLAASGCCAVDFQIDTGSQRLLEDFYGNDFSVSPMESVLRACRALGLYTAVHLTFPCPHDDRHTEDETLRLLARCRPSAAVLRPPRLLPGSPWCVRAPEFGFRIVQRRYARWARAMLGSARPSHAVAAALPGTCDLELAYHMSGWSQERAVEARLELGRQIRALNVSLAGSAQLGLMARLAGHTGRENEFIERFARALFTFDVETAASCAACINAIAIQPKNTYVLRPLQSVLAAVAN